MLQQLVKPFEVKELSETGAFEGLASVYGNVDLGGDIVMPGAIKESVLTRDGFIRILDGHNTRAPIGKGKLTDTHMGLAIKGQLNLKISRARDVYELMKDNVIDGLSIGYDILAGGSELRMDGVRELRAIKLWEVSATAFPMNQAAVVSTVKSIEQITNVRDYEDFLREVGKFSKQQAKILAAAWKNLPGQRDAEPQEDGAQGDAEKGLFQFLNSIKQTKL